MALATADPRAGEGPAAAGPAAAGPAGPLRSVLEAGARFCAAVSALAVSEVPVGRVPELVESLAACERLAAAARVRLGPVVAEGGLHRRSGDPDPASYLARVAGSSWGRAKADLALAERLAEVPELDRAYGAGRVSTDQARLIAPVAEAAPEAVGELVSAAAAGSYAALRSLARRARRRGRTEDDEVATERRVHAGRYCRTLLPEAGGVRLEAWLTAVEGAAVAAALRARADQLFGARWAAAKATGEPVEPHERLMADALVELCGGHRVRTELVVTVDAAALVRGEAAPTETCEVKGVGPVSVRTARSLLGEGFVTLLVTDGADITTVTSTTRVVPRRVQKALWARDRGCAVPGCAMTEGLEIDHVHYDFAQGGLTALDNLVYLCRGHHRLKTRAGWRLLGGPGTWRWVGPGRRDPGPGP